MPFDRAATGPPALLAVRRPVPAHAGAALQRLAPAAALASLAVVLFAGAMVADLGYDEEQYIAGGLFARGLSLYGDFISFQPPAYTWLLSWVFEAVDGWYLLSARILTWVFALGSCLLLYSLLMAQGRALDRLFARSPPAAIVAGFGPFRLFGAMDDALIDYARRSGYVLVADDRTVWPYPHKNAQVWIRPAPGHEKGVR